MSCILLTPNTFKIKWGETEDKITDWDWTGNTGSEKAGLRCYCRKRDLQGKQQKETTFWVLSECGQCPGYYARHWSCIIPWKFLGACVVIFILISEEGRVRTRESRKLSRVKGEFELGSRCFPSPCFIYPTAQQNVYQSNVSTTRG